MAYFKSLRYYDEMLFVMFFFLISMETIKSHRIKKIEAYTYLLMIVLLILGLFGNSIFKYQTNKFAILLDVINNYKIIIICFGFYHLLNKINSKIILKKMSFLAKTFIYVSFFCSIISIFFDIGMRGQMRFGIWGFNFIYDYAHIFSMMLLTMLIILSSTENDQKLKYYVFISVIELILTLKGISFVCAFVLLYLSYFPIKKKRISIWSMALFIIASLILGRYQINTYFRSNSPRLVLIIRSAQIFIKHFPLGTGFGTFGSSVAASYYSDLYRRYGVNQYWGMTEYDTRFLNDNYWPMIVAQFNILGLILVCSLLLILFKYLQKVNIHSNTRAILLSAISYTLVASLGTSIYTTSSTIIMAVSIVMVLVSKEEVI